MTDGIHNIPAALWFDNVRVRYAGAGRDALSGCTFSIAAGERVGLLGLNGSGKTTVLLAAAGLLSSTGTIQVGGRHVRRADLSAIRRDIGFLFSTPEDQILFPDVLEDVAFTLLRRGDDREASLERARAMLCRLQADDLEHSAPYALSHGQRLRVALAGALVSDPPLLLLDEPTGALDPPSRNRLASLLRGFPSAVLLATHDLPFAEQCCDRFLLIREGRIVLGTKTVDSVRALWEASVY